MADHRIFEVSVYVLSAKCHARELVDEPTKGIRFGIDRHFGHMVATVYMVAGTAEEANQLGIAYLHRHFGQTETDYAAQRFHFPTASASIICVPNIDTVPIEHLDLSPVL